MAISDIADVNLAVAKAFGADHVVNVADGKQNLLDLVMNAHRRTRRPKGVQHVGSSESILESLRMLANAGVVVLMATKEKEFTVPSLLISGERAIRTSANAMLSDFPKAVELLEAGMLKVDPLVTHRFPLSRAIDAFAVACSKDQNGAIKIVIDCQS